MSTVKSALAQKSGALIHVRSGDMVVEALLQMRDNRVRSVLVIDDDVLVGIVTQGDCAIKVLLPGLDAKQTPVSQVMTGKPVTVKPDDPLQGCMAMMAARARSAPCGDARNVSIDSCRAYEVRCGSQADIRGGTTAPRGSPVSPRGRPS